MSRTTRIVANCVIIAASIYFLFAVDVSARRARIPASGDDLPERGSAFLRVPTERDVYQAYAGRGLHGVRAVHLNRHMNFVDYFPREEARSAPFPLPVRTVAELYEKGLDPHNWLFIATRTGMVRAVSTVLTRIEFGRLRGSLSSDFAFTFIGGYYRGFNYDTPWEVSTLETMPFHGEPVVISVNAGYFMDGEEPAAAARLLRNRCPKAAMLVLVDSADETDITAQARRDLNTFGAAWSAQ